jgi:hypothetical protein
MKETSARKLKIAIDVLAVVFIATFFMCLALSNGGPAPNRLLIGKMPLPIAVLLADIIPCALSFFWLCYRYAEAIAIKYPIVRKPAFKILACFSIAILVTLIGRSGR